MITGAHAIIYTQDADADRAFFRDVLGFDSVDAGHGWLIFKLPPAELAAHPHETGGRHELYLMCDDVAATVEELKATTQSGQAPRLWLTEQGGRFNLPADEQSAPTPGADFCNLMQFRHISNRITRFYYYPLVGPPPEPDGSRVNDSALIALNSDGLITPRDPQYETYKFYASKTGGSQRC